MPIDQIKFTQTGYIEVYDADGNFVSQHRLDDEAKEKGIADLLSHLATLPDGIHNYTFRYPDVRMSIRLLNQAQGSQGGAQEADITPPLPPAGAYLNNYTANSVTHNWTSNSEPDVAGYRIYKSVTSSTSGFSLLADVAAPATSYVESGYDPSAQAWYKITAYDNASPANESDYSAVYYDIAAPAAPDAPTISNIGATSFLVTPPTSAALDHATWQYWVSENGGAYTLRATSATSVTISSLAQNTSYSVQLRDVDVMGNVSALGAAVSAETVTVSWASESAITFTEGVAGTYDLLDDVTDASLAQSFGVDASSPEQLPSSITLQGAKSSVLTYDGAGSAVVRNIKFYVTDNSAESDWQARIAAAGVVWYHGFESDAEVDQFRWAGGYAGGNDPLALTADAGYMTRSATGGPTGGYLEILHPSQTGAPNVNWWRPFSPLAATGNGRSTDDPANGHTLRTWAPTDGSSTTQLWGQDFWGPSTYQETFYLQMRVMTDPRRTAQAGVENVGKKLYLTTTTKTLTAQEIVAYSGSSYLRLYVGGSPPIEQKDTLSRPGQQVGGELSTYPGNYCDVGTNPGQCWQWATDGTWDTVMFAITPGTTMGSGPTVTSHVTVYGAHAGETSYTTIYDLDYTHQWDQTNQYGWNAIALNTYQNGATMTEFWQRYADIIFSTQPIACPQV